jgi:hypothetical protein
MAIAFSLLSSIGIGYMEIITIVGGPLSVKPGDIGLASGLQFSTRTAFSSLAGKDSFLEPRLRKRLLIHISSLCLCYYSGFDRFQILISVQ